jgi:hypothetical protein
MELQSRSFSAQAPCRYPGLSRARIQTKHDGELLPDNLRLPLWVLAA